MSESMSGVAPEIRLGSEPRRAERWSNDVDGGGRAAFGEAAFVERALAILARQARPPDGAATGAALPSAPPFLSPLAPVVSTVSGLASPASPALPLAVPPFLPASLATAAASSSPCTPASAPALSLPAVETLRQQAVEWIDSLLALVTAGFSPTPVRTNLVAVGAGSPPASVPMAPNPAAGLAPGPALPAVALPVAAAAPVALSQLAAAAAGQTVATTLRVANDRAVDAPVRFVASDLVGDSGARIPASAVTFSPSATIVAAQAVRAVEVLIAIPVGTPAGAYTGLLQLIGQPLARSLLAVDVKPAAARGPGTAAPTPGARA